MGIPAADGNSRDYEFGRSYYTVRSGDNLTTISKATGFPISVIAEANNIKDPNKIEVGQKLVFVHESDYPDPASAYLFLSNDSEAWNDHHNDEVTAHVSAWRIAEVDRQGAQEYVRKMDTKG